MSACAASSGTGDAMARQYSGFDGSVTVTDDDVIMLDFGSLAHVDKKAAAPVRIPRSEIVGAELVPSRGLTMAYLRIHRLGEPLTRAYNPKKDPCTLFLSRAKDIEAVRPLVDWLTGRRPDLAGQVTRNAKGARRDVSDARQGMVNKFGARRELRNLEKRLLPGELVEHVAGGRYAGRLGLLVLTDQRLLFNFDGLMTQRTEDIPVSSISSVHIKSGLLRSRIDVTASGTRITIESVQKLDAEPLAARLRQRISGAALAPPGTFMPPAPAAASTGSPGSLDVTQQLERLADLRDRGALSDAEFVMQKARVLGT